jgi:hypothetical protein
MSVVHLGVIYEVTGKAAAQALLRVKVLDLVGIWAKLGLLFAAWNIHVELSTYIARTSYYHEI